LLAQRAPELRVTAIDLAEQMLILARKNVAREHLEDRVTLLRRDVKDTGFPAASFDLVLSNSLVHHIPEPLAFFVELQRVSRVGAGLFVRDLLRPTSQSELVKLVELHAGDCNDYQRRLFSDSLHAALTVDEVRELCAQAGLDVAVKQTSDRHWTIERTRSPVS
jgi:ubiquinone/menaquinone biosynthesis C-methylase UbiE